MVLVPVQAAVGPCARPQVNNLATAIAHRLSPSSLVARPEGGIVQCVEPDTAYGKLDLPGCVRGSGRCEAEREEVRASGDLLRLGPCGRERARRGKKGKSSESAKSKLVDWETPAGSRERDAGG